MKLLIDHGLDESAWDTALLSHPESHFLQSWAWGEFQSSLGRKIWRLAVESEGELVAQLLVIKQALGFGQSILYSPRGNLAPKHSSAADTQSAGRMLLEAIEKLAAEQGCLFFRIDPPVADSDIATLAWYRQLGFVPNAKKPIQPQHNQVLSLAAGYDRTLSQAKSKTRYNMSVAKRHNLETSSTADEESIQAFLSLMQDTASRQGFTPHSSAYLEKQIRFFTGKNMADIITVRSQGQPLSSLFIVYFHQTATYLHGASSSQERGLMAPYLAHDVAIRTAIARGMQHYDLGGVQPDPKHHWAGITRFKQGFGGETVSYIGSLELPQVKWKYTLYRLLNNLR